MPIPEIVLVVAVARNGVIGNRNALPWHIPGDLRRFRRLTIGRPVVMGRKTFESIGIPLPGRQNIVVSRNPAWNAPGVTVVPNLAEAVAAGGLHPSARPDEIMVIGGAELFREALPIATRLELTEVALDPEGDVHMPPLGAGWKEVAREHVAAEGDIPAHDFVTLMRAADPETPLADDAGSG